MPILQHLVCAEKIVEKRLQVVVAIVVNDAEQVLIAKRQAHQHQGNLWEFPGGKREAGETALQALQREILEEVGLRVERAKPLIKISHDYAERAVELDVWLVTAFHGEATGREGQPVEWCAVAELQNRDFPQANLQIIERLQGLYQH